MLLLKIVNQAKKGNKHYVAFKKVFSNIENKHN